MVEKLRVERSVDGVRSNVALPDRIFIYLPSIFLPFTLPISLQRSCESPRSSEFVSR